MNHYYAIKYSKIFIEPSISLKEIPIIMKGLLAIVSPLRASNVANSVESVLQEDLYQVVNKEFINQPTINICFSTYSSIKNKTSDESVTSDSTRDNSSIMPLVVNGEIFNINKKYNSELSAKAECVKDPDDLGVKNEHNVQINESLLHSLYSEYKNDYLAHVKGNFTFVLWDNDKNIIRAVVSPFNAKTLFYTVFNGVFYIASDAKVLSNIPGITITPNKNAISQWLAGRPDPNISMFNEIHQIPQGHELVWDNGTITLKQFWDIDTNNLIEYSNSNEYQEHFYDLLTRSVSSRVPAFIDKDTLPFATQMSGGMDSTSVTAIANTLSKQSNATLHTLSHSYKNTQSCDEMTNITDMISTLGLQHSHFIELDKFDGISFGELYPTDFDSPGIVLSPKYHEELTLLQGLGVSTLLTGNGGDEVCWGHSSSYRSRLYKGELGVIPEVVKACGELNEPVVSSLVNLFVKPLVPHSLQNLLRLARGRSRLLKSDTPVPNWLTDEAKDCIASSVIVNPYDGVFEPAKHARYHSLKTTSTFNSMRSYQKVADHYGVDVKHPFFDVDVVAFSFAIPEKLLIQGSYPKWLLRKTMEKHLPESVVWNKHKTVFDHHFANLVRSNQKELTTLLSHTGLQELGVLNNAVLLAEFDELVNNPARHLNVDMLYAILTQLWFQTHFD